MKEFLRSLRTRALFRYYASDETLYRETMTARTFKPKFHYADFPEASPDGEVGRGRHGEVGIVEFRL